MSYATQAELETRFGAAELAQLTDRIEGAVIDAAVVARAIADADAEIDAYLATRYALPLASVPALLARMACDIARYRLHAEGAPERIRKTYEDAVRDLKAVARGDIKIDGAAPLTAAADSAGVAHRAPARIFDADGLAGY